MSVWLGLGSGNWSTPGNWVSNSVPNAIGAVADFSNLAGGAISHAINLQLVGKTVGTISLASSAIENYSIQSGTLIMQVASGSAAINVTASGAAPLPTIFAPTLNLFLASPTVVSTQAYVGGFGTLDIQGQISGSGSLTANGAGTLKLSHDNSGWSGDSFLAQSLVVANNANAFGSGDIYFSGGVLKASASFTLANAISVTATHVGAIEAASHTTLTLTGAFSNLGNTLFFGDAQNTGVIVFSSSAVTTAFVPTGVINLDGGVLRDAAGLNVLLSGANNLDIASGAKLELGAGGYAVNNLSGTGQIHSYSGQTTLELHYDSNVIFGGVISDGVGTVSLIKFGPGNSQPFLTGVNTYTGTTSIAEGRLSLADAGSIANSSHVYTNPNATFDISFISAAAANIIDMTHAGHVNVGGKTLNILHQTGDLGGFFDGSLATEGLAVNMAATLANFSLSTAFFSQWTDGTDTITVNGNALNNIITGTGHADTLNGGIGGDTLLGGAGDDRFYVDSALDTVIEGVGAGSGLDLIFSSVSYTIAANAERLYLTGLANISGTGLDGQGDVIYGNAGNNILDGKTGTDNLNGGNGNDSYYVNTSIDVVNEAAGAAAGALDTIFSQSSYTINANVERLFLLDGGNYNANGRDGQNDFLAGNTGANIINGFSGDDTIRGGLGNDTLTGGAGLDTFQFLTLGNTAANRDIITDFNIADDVIQLDNAVYTLLGANGALAANLFKNLLTAQDADDRILYDQANGNLYYDSNGLAAGGVVHFAEVSNGLALTAGDFVVV